VCAIKRSIVLGFILLSCAPTGFPREGQIPAKKDNLYSVALFASVSEMEKSWGHIDDSNGGSRIRTDFRHVLVEKDPEITDGLPSQEGDYRVEYLDSREQMDRYKKLRKEFAILRIRPMQSDGSLLKIQVSVSYLTYEKHKFLLAISDWSDVEFRYDCGNQKFVVYGVKPGGI
jgi:hypothetical protein